MWHQLSKITDFCLIFLLFRFFTARKMKSSIKDFCSKCDQIRSFLEKVFVWPKSYALAKELFASIKDKIIKITWSYEWVFINRRGDVKKSRIKGTFKTERHVISRLSIFLNKESLSLCYSLKFFFLPKINVIQTHALKNWWTVRMRYTSIKPRDFYPWR